MAIDWTQYTGLQYAHTGIVEYRVEDDGLVRWRGLTTQSIAAAIPYVVLSTVTAPLEGVVPLYYDWTGVGSRSIHIPTATPGQPLYWNYNGPYDIGVVVNLAGLSYQGTPPPPAVLTPPINTPATYSLGGLVFNTRLPDASGHTWYANLEGLGSPQSRATDTPRTGADGSLFAGGYNGTRQLTLEGTVRGADRTALKAARNRLAQALDLVRALGTLVVNDPIPFQLGVYRADEVKWQPLSHIVAAWQVGLVAPDPRRYGTVLQSLSTTLSAITTGVSADVSADVSAGGGTASQVVANNAGTADTFPTYEIQGPVTNPVITHDESGSVIRLAIVLTASDVLVIDTDARTITLGTETRRYTAVGAPGWHTLAPGTNTIRFAAASTDPAATLTVRWRDAYA